MDKRTTKDYEVLKKIDIYHIIKFKDIFDDGQFTYFISDKDDASLNLFFTF